MGIDECGIWKEKVIKKVASFMNRAFTLIAGISLLSLISCIYINGTEKEFSDVEMQWGKSIYKIDSCVAISSNNILVINFFNKIDRFRDYELQIIKEQTLKIEINQSSIPTDSNYVPAVFHSLKQEILFDKDVYSSNDIINGELNITALGYKAYFKDPEEKIKKPSFDTVYVKGKFRVKVL
ncbi:MAG: hypothetical protein KDB99_00185 [Chitinophagaceae bacterium]|nr:hypothetical protein [Chitinophagaceae bacterium]